MTLKNFNKQWEMYKFYHDLEKTTTYEEFEKKQAQGDECL